MEIRMLRWLIVIGLLVGSVTPSWAAPSFTPVASSTFTTGAGGENPLSEGGVWTNSTASGEGGWKKIQDAVTDATGIAAAISGTVDSVAFYSGASFNANQYSRGKLYIGSGASGGERGVGLALLRSAAATATYYRFAIDHAGGGTPTNNAVIACVAAGVYTRLGTVFSQAFTEGDQFTFAVEGTTLYLYDKTLALITTRDASGCTGHPTSGSPGLLYSSNEGTAEVDNWEGGNFSSSSGSSSRTLMLLGVGP